MLYRKCSYGSVYLCYTGNVVMVVYKLCYTGNVVMVVCKLCYTGNVVMVVYKLCYTGNVVTQLIVQCPVYGSSSSVLKVKCFSFQ